jgi:flavin reductase (DIM6/NTAB) family NADH-FMN oxidoreductase RutF
MLVDLSTLPTALTQQYLQYAVAPRPICFASTINAKGQVNLSPFSFFNLFSANPPIIIFSPSNRLRNNTIKHSLENVLDVPEVVIAIVDEAMVNQVSLASCEYEKGISEFIKAGFTPATATLIRPPLVKESKINLECKVIEVKSLGSKGGAGNLVICEVLCMHINESILNAQGMINPLAIKQVGRLGGDWYCTVTPDNLFQVEKPNTLIAMGIDALPMAIRKSNILTGHHLAQLANVTTLPIIDPGYEDEGLKNIFHYYALQPEEMEKEIHVYAKNLLDKKKVKEAWQVLLAITDEQ